MTDYAVAVIPPSGNVLIERVPLGAGELEALQKYVGGYIELVRVKYNGRNCIAYVNEDGRSLELAENTRATKAFKDVNPQNHSMGLYEVEVVDCVLGTMVVCLETPNE